MPKRPGKEVQCNKMPLIRGSFKPQTYAGRSHRVKLRAEPGHLGILSAFVQINFIEVDCRRAGCNDE